MLEKYGYFFISENKILKLLQEENLLKKMDLNSLLLLLKMYKFDIGMAYLLEKFDRNEVLI